MSGERGEARREAAAIGADVAAHSIRRPPAARLRGVAVRERGRRLVGPVDLELEPGLVHGLIGPNGAGKSTLLRALLGLVRHEGEIEARGCSLDGLRARERARELAYLPQEQPSGLECTGRELVRMSRYARLRRFAGLGPDDEAAVERALRRTGAEAWADRPVGETSGGERQLTGLARAMAQEARMLVLDEPSSALDFGRQLAAMRLLGPWIADAPPGERTVLAVLHDLGLASRVCDRLHLLGSGGIVASGTPEEVLREGPIAEAYGVEVRVGRSELSGAIEVAPV